MEKSSEIQVPEKIKESLHKEEHKIEKNETKDMEAIVKGETILKNETEEATEISETKIEVMERDAKEVCCIINKDVRCMCHCCIKTWSFSLNACEGCCTISSATCLFLSSVAIGIRDCLEFIDCNSK